MTRTRRWSDARVQAARSVEDAVATLADLDGRAAPLAGATWVMRGAGRDEPAHELYVDLHGISELGAVDVGAETARIGAGVTHTQLAGLPAAPSLAVVREAAAASAFPAVRNVATVGGNIAAVEFAEADLVPALLAAEADVELATPGGRRREPLAALLPRREEPGASLITAVFVPLRTGRASAYERLTVRGGGEYAVASVALSVDLDEDGVVRAARLALGAVEAVARIDEAASEALVGERLSAARARAAGKLAAGRCAARDDGAAPGWYRKAVLPALVERAAATVALGWES